MVLYTGATVEEAIQKGLNDLDIPRMKAHITVVAREKKGFLGVKLEDLEDSQDGAKLWFALLKENEFIQEVEPV